MFNIKAEPLPCLTGKQMDYHIMCYLHTVFRNCQEPQRKTCVTQPISCHSRVYQMTPGEDKVRPECPQTFCNLTSSGQLRDEPV